MDTIQRVSVENFLSLEKLDLQLGPLNVLVGPNGAGKSNILKIFQFLGDVARFDLIPAIESFGGYSEIMFRGNTQRAKKSIKIEFQGIISQYASVNAPDEYTLSFWNLHERLFRRHETISIKRTAGRGRRITLAGGSVRVQLKDQKQVKQTASLTVQQSATGLATLRRLGEEYEAAGVEALAHVFESLRLFDIDVEQIRLPSRHSEDHSLKQSASNIAYFLKFLAGEHPVEFQRICDDVEYVLPGFKGFKFIKIGGSDDTIRVDLLEEGLSGSTPLARASYGTIRSIAIFCMLNDPNPPKLTCLEEIDHGLHPHALDRVVERLRDASKKTQIILATHSPALVNRLEPSELVIVERIPETGGSHVFRPDAKLVNNLKLETQYGLGELWFSGAIGGGL